MDLREPARARARFPPGTSYREDSASGGHRPRARMSRGWYPRRASALDVSIRPVLNLPRPAGALGVSTSHRPISRGGHMSKTIAVMYSARSGMGPVGRSRSRRASYTRPCSRPPCRSTSTPRARTSCCGRVPSSTRSRDAGSTRCPHAMRPLRVEEPASDALQKTVAAPLRIARYFARRGRRSRGSEEVGGETRESGSKKACGERTASTADMRGSS